MAELPKVEQQSSGQVLRDLKATVANLKKEVDASKHLLKKVAELYTQNTFYEKKIDSARGRIFALLVAQVRSAEATHADEYIAQVDEAIAQQTKDDKKAVK